MIIYFFFALYFSSARWVGIFCYRVGVYIYSMLCWFVAYSCRFIGFLLQRALCSYGVFSETSNTQFLFLSFFFFTLFWYFSFLFFVSLLFCFFFTLCDIFCYRLHTLDFILTSFFLFLSFCVEQVNKGINFELKERKQNGNRDHPFSSRKIFNRFRRENGAQNYI